MNIIKSNKLKSWWRPLVIMNTSKEIKNFHNNILEFNVHFESKLIWFNNEMKKVR
jgi:hypothetical protein